ncbi:MAG: trigger factor [Candidatus Pacebacteria bacterium]|nr:trigger factor [Candidatus Paceibacterota bacterium]
MEIKVKKLQKTKIEMEVEVPTQEFNEFFDKATIGLGKNIQVPGFRSGNVPKQMLLEKIGQGNILNEAAHLCIQDVYVKALLNENLEPISQPSVEILKLAYQNPFCFKAIFFVIPEIKLCDYKKIAMKIKRREVVVSLKDIDEALSFIQKSRPNFKQVSRPAEKGDFIEIEFSSPQIDNAKIQKDAFILGKGHLVKDFGEKLEKMEIGQKKSFFVKFPEKHFQQNLAGKNIYFEVEMKAIKELEQAEINDEFAKQLGNFENLKALKKSVEQGIKLEKQNAETQRTRSEILEQIEKKCGFETPEILIESEKQRMLETVKQMALKNFNLEFKDYLEKIKKTEKEFLDSLEKESIKRTRNFLILREISKKENIKVGEQEINQEIENILKQYPDVEKTKKTIDPKKLRDYTKERIINEKTLAKLESFVN